MNKNRSLVEQPPLLVTVVIINYHTLDLLKQCLTSLFSNTSISFETIVVDNSNSSEEYKSLLDLLKHFPGCRAIDAGDNVGVSKANNMGFRASRGKYVFLLNSDTVILNDALSILVDEMEKNDSIVGACPNLFGADLRPTHSFLSYEMTPKNIARKSGIFATIARKFFHANDSFNYSDSALEIKGYICAAALLLRKDSVFSVGLEDEDIFMYGDDFLLCHKLIASGGRLFNFPAAKIQHLEGGSDEKRWSQSKVQNYVRGTFLSLYKAFGATEYKRYYRAQMKAFRNAKLKNWLRHPYQYENYKALLREGAFFRPELFLKG